MSEEEGVVPVGNWANSKLWTVFYGDRVSRRFLKNIEAGLKCKRRRVGVPSSVAFPSMSKQFGPPAWRATCSGTINQYLTRVLICLFLYL